MFHHSDFTPFSHRARPSLRATVSNMIENWPEAAYREDAAVIPGSWPLMPQTLVLTGPELIEEVLVGRAEKFMRDPFQTRALTNVVNRKSMFFAEGAEWRWQRRAASPAFRHENLMTLAPIFARHAKARADVWRRAGRVTLDVAPAMTETTFAIILDAVLGEGARALDQQRFLNALNPTFASVAWRFLYARIGAPAFLPFPGSRRLAGGVAFLQEAMTQLLDARRAAGGAPKDLLSLLLSASDPESGRAMADDEILANLYTLMVAGHETSATALAWTLWILAKDQETQERVREEVAAIVGARDLEPDDLERLTFTKQVLQEAMRLFPPAYAFGRAPLEDLRLGPHWLKKGELALIGVWCVHRHETLWEEPAGFDPDRFAPEKAKARPRCAYLPFGAGPRICIGMNFALMEMIALLATFVRACRFSPVAGHGVKIAANLTLRSKTGLPLEIAPV
jgi:cytochrome P450